MFQEAVERFHQLDHCDVRTVVDELVIGVGSVGPAPCVGERMELRLTYLPAWLAKEDVVIGVRVKRRIEIDQIDTRIWKFAAIGQPLEIVTKVQTIHSNQHPEISPLRSK